MKELKPIIANNTECINPNDKLQLRTTTSLITKNNNSPTPPPLKQTNVVYEFSCPLGECELQQSSYIGMTTTTLRPKALSSIEGRILKKKTVSPYDDAPGIRRPQDSPRYQPQHTTNTRYTCQQYKNPKKRNRLQQTTNTISLDNEAKHPSNKQPNNRHT